MNRVIFLDIDGVICTIREFHMTNIAKTYVHKYNVYPFNPKCVKVLNEILEKTDATIVLSSDWRIHYNIGELKDIFNINGVIKYPKYITEDFYKMIKKDKPKATLEDIRGEEIKTFLKENEVDKYVVIDDLNMEKDFGDKFILCPEVFEGIKQSGLKDKILEVLI